MADGNDDERSGRRSRHNLGFGDLDRSGSGGTSDGPVPGKRTLALDWPAQKSSRDPSTQQKVQRKGDGDLGDVHGAAAQGISGSSGALPYLEAIQRSFGAHDVSSVHAHTDAAAAAGAAAMGAEAFATGDHVAFGGAPSLHTAAHEAAHVVQQRAGVHLMGGVGEVGDEYEQHADAVADRVVQGKSAEDLLDRMAPRSTGDQTVQRRAAVQMNQEFVPVISPPAATVSKLKLFEEKAVTFSITNRAKAPPGTTFHWGGGIQGDVLSLGEIKRRDHDATIDLHVKADKTGNTKVQGTPQHQVPGGPQVTGETRYQNITVQQATQELLSVTHLRGGAQISPTTDHAAVGDQLKFRIMLANLDARGLGATASVVMENGGNNKASLATRVQVFADKALYDVTVTCGAIGAVNGHLSLAPEINGVGQSIAPPVAIAFNVDMDKALFLQKCNNCNTAIDLADRAATAWLASVANAYAAAWTKHTGVLKDQDASNRLVGDLILGAALAFIPGGIGGVVGAGMKKLTSDNAFLVDGVKDLVKWGLRDGGKAALSGGKSAPMSAFPAYPLQWQNKETIRIKSELAVATKTLLDWQTKATANDPAFFMNFDPIEAMQAGLNVGGQPAATLVPVDTASYSISFEKGFWKGWLENYAYTVQITPNKGGPHASSTENSGKKVKERCEQIGLDWKPYAKVSEDKADQEAAQKNHHLWGV